MEIERSRSRSQEKAKKFRIQSKSWFLTYPRLNKSKEEALVLLQNKLAGKPYVGMVVCRELHEDGFPHIHAFVLLKDQFQCVNERFWDIEGHHGNYQKARDITSVAKYIKKDGDYLEHGEISWKEKLNAREEHRKYLGKRLIDGEPLEQVVRENPQLLFGLKHLEQDLHTWKRLTLKPHETTSTRGVWIFGRPGVGKSHYVRAHEPDLYLKAQNKWWDGYVGQKAVLIDDFDKQGVCLSHYLKIWADKYSCTGEIKGSNVALVHDKFYVTSNYSIDQLFDPNEDREINQALKRRFKQTRMLNWDDFRVNEETED